MSQQTLFSFFKKPTAPASGEKAASGPKGGDPAPRQRGTPAVRPARFCRPSTAPSRDVPPPRRLTRRFSLLQGGVPTPKGAKGSKGGGARGKVQPAARKAAPRAKPAKAAAPRGRKVVESDEEEEPAKESSKGRESKGAEGGGDEPPRKRPARATTAAPAAAARDESDEDEALMSSSDEESASEASVGESGAKAAAFAPNAEQRSHLRWRPATAATAAQTTSSARLAGTRERSRSRSQQPPCERSWRRKQRRRSGPGRAPQRRRPS